MILGGWDFDEFAGSGSQGMTPDAGDGDGDRLTGPGTTLCRRENPIATSATNTISAAATDSSRSIECLAGAWGDAAARTMMLACSWAGGSVPSLKAGASRRRPSSSWIGAPLMQEPPPQWSVDRAGHEAVSARGARGL